MAKVATLEDLQEIEKTPLSERNLPESTYAMFQQAAEKYGDKQALAFFLQAKDYEKAVHYSYRDLLARITQAANMFHGLGVGPNDAVSYILPNLPQTYFTLYGGEAAGIGNPINPLLEPHVLAEIMNAAQTKVLVTITPFPNTDLWGKVSQIANDVPTLETILQIDIAQYLGFIPKLVVNFMRRGQNKTGHLKAKVLNFDTEMAKYPSNKLTSGRQIKSTDHAAYFHTGGTTGTPKLAIHTHANQVFDGWSAGFGVDADSHDCVFLGLPLFHNYGAIVVPISSWINGASVILATPSGYRGEGVVPNLWKIVEHFKCTNFPAVPTLYTSLLNVPIDGADISSLSISSSGAAPLPMELAKQFEAYTGVKILEGYGLTEATSANTVNPRYGETKVGSVGFPMPYQKVRTVILEGDQFIRFCNPEEVGVVAMKGPAVFAGYKEDFYNKGVFFEADDGDKWLNTGDMGRIDEDGYLWLTGRKKELIIRGGHNIDPKLIEEPMHKHPAVALAAAIGRPDSRVGEMPVAYVQLKPGSSATEDELLKFAQENIGERAAIPKAVHIIDEMPQTNVGKILKRPLVYKQVVEVLTNDLKGIDGIADLDIWAETDKRLGTLAHITAKCADGADAAALESKIKEACGQYTVANIIKVN